MENIESLLESVRDLLPGHPSTLVDGEISPLIPKRLANIEPGKDTPDLYRFHQIFPELFNEETNFMGGQFGNLDSSYWKGVDQFLFSINGKFDTRGSFHAPVAVYKSKAFKHESYILFQLGNYQIIENDEGLIEQGKIKIYRGVRNRDKYISPNLMGRNKEKYFEYLASSFLSPSLVLGFNGKLCRAETNHVNSRLIDDFYISINVRRDFRSMELPHSTSKHVSSGKFGPNYASMITDLDNIRIFSQWTGESEVYLLDSERVEDIQFHRAV